MSFHVGQKVVCVAPQEGLYAHGMWEGVLKKDAIYTVRWIGRHEHIFAGEYTGVRLEGITRTDMDDTPFHCERFRPLVEDHKSVSFTIGADPDSERWDNRKKIKERT